MCEWDDNIHANEQYRWYREHMGLSYMREIKVQIVERHQSIQEEILSVREQAHKFGFLKNFTITVSMTLLCEQEDEL